MEDSLYLTDLIDVMTLQRIQDAFSDMTGIAALTTDRNGVAVTKGSNFSDFCMKYTRQSEAGCARCELCDKSGAELALEEGRSVTYSCHAGLVDFAAPIMAQGQLVGCFIGGQILTEEPNYEKIRKIAADIGVDPEEYVDAAKRISYVHKNQVEKSAEFLYSIAGVFSNIAYGKYLALQAKQEMERAASMKSDFLANMTHEIRTPMNAVIGMAEMALREELPPAAREYINQIKSSGKALLTIINDILDFSKIESGKMDISPIEYEPMSIINDISNIIMTRIGEKDVELILDIAPDIPNKLLGDNIRIKQIMVNLANNAVKFTPKGQVLLKMQYERIGKEELELQVSVEDTGIGIKKEDMGKLFHSFQQVDSKRNRNIEGTGLGLAISKQLLELMDGRIDVKSEYEKGSEFSFVIPQKIVEDVPSITRNDWDNVVVVDFMKNAYISEQLKRDSECLGVAYCAVDSEEKLMQRKQKEKELFIFVEQVNLTPAVEKLIRENPQITFVLLVDFNVMVEFPMSNLIVIKKPLYALNLAMIFNHEELRINFGNGEEEEFDFIAPEAKILIVDDNPINLTVAEGLLEPLKLQIDTAASGKEAIGKISLVKYDIILMDHMMPELDGVETTHIIRRFYKEYDDVPIIALTANAVSGTKEMFLAEGMNDFVAKPIELRILTSKIKCWLSPEKIEKVHRNSGIEEKVENVIYPHLEIGDLDTDMARKLLGSETLYWSVLKDYYRVIEKKADLIKKLEQKEDFEAYTIEVHALKSVSKQIGAIALSEQAAILEKAADEKAAALIHEKTDEMLEKYRGYIALLAPYFAEEEENGAKEAVSEEVLNALFVDMREALENLDMDQMEAVVAELKQYHYAQKWERELLSKLSGAVEEMDVDSCEAILGLWEKQK